MSISKSVPDVYTDVVIGDIRLTVLKETTLDGPRFTLWSARWEQDESSRLHTFYRPRADLWMVSMTDRVADAILTIPSALLPIRDPLAFEAALDAWADYTDFT